MGCLFLSTTYAQVSDGQQPVIHDESTLVLVDVIAPDSFLTFPTHNPTHKKYVLYELPRTLAVPAVLYVVVKPMSDTLTR
jgi:hypothetical protein